MLEIAIPWSTPSFFQTYVAPADSVAFSVTGKLVQTTIVPPGVIFGTIHDLLRKNETLEAGTFRCSSSTLVYVMSGFRITVDVADSQVPVDERGTAGHSWKK